MVMARVVDGPASLPTRGIKGRVDKVADGLMGVDTIILLPLTMVRATNKRCLKVTPNFNEVYKHPGPSPNANLLPC